jgi:hypothetical protein
VWLAREVDAVPEMLGASEFGIFPECDEVRDEMVVVCQVVRDLVTRLQVDYVRLFKDLPVDKVCWTRQEDWFGVIHRSIATRHSL